jgi:predicted membrane protein (TIGR00267 family)
MADTVPAHSYDPKLARMLILDELFDLTLYQAMRNFISPASQKVLDELIVVETRHLAFWQKFFDIRLTSLDWPRRLKLRLLLLICRLFREPAVQLVLEAIEVHGVRKYLSVWKRYKGQPLARAVKDVLMDEFEHEDVLVAQIAGRRINPERIRNIFLGLNDGLVEILGAVSGFFGAFGNPVMVLIAAMTTAVAGSFSMAAGAYVALSSEREVGNTELAKKEFLEGTDPVEETRDRPLVSSLLVGGSYFAGALVPVLPVLFGAMDVFFSMLSAGIVIILVSMILAFLSGMNVKRRIAMNLVILGAAVGITYAIGLAARRLWGITV